MKLKIFTEEEREENFHRLLLLDFKTEYSWEID